MEKTIKPEAPEEDPTQGPVAGQNYKFTASTKTLKLDVTRRYFDDKFLEVLASKLETIVEDTWKEHKAS